MDTMNTQTTIPAQAEVTADAAVDAVETVIWRHEHGEEIFSGMLKDANEGVAALRKLVEADEEYDAAQRALGEAMFGTENEKSAAAVKFSRATHLRQAALAACRAVGGAR